MPVRVSRLFASKTDLWWQLWNWYAKCSRPLPWEWKLETWDESTSRVLRSSICLILLFQWRTGKKKCHRYSGQFYFIQLFVTLLKQITDQTHERSFHSCVSGYFIRVLLTNVVWHQWRILWKWFLLNDIHKFSSNILPTGYHQHYFINCNLLFYWTAWD